MALAFSHTPPLGWASRLGAWLDRLNYIGRALAGDESGLEKLSDRQLADIGVKRTDVGAMVDSDFAALRRRGIGPLV